MFIKPSVTTDSRNPKRHRRSGFGSMLVALALGCSAPLTGSAEDIYYSGAQRFVPTGDLQRMSGGYSARAMDDGHYVTFPLDRDYQAFNGTRLIGVDEPLGAGPTSQSVGEVTSGTAYLYESFANGTLPEYAYGEFESERALRDAIWTLEGFENATTRNDNRFLRQVASRYGSLDEAKSPYIGSAVRVISLVPDERKSELHGFFGKLERVHGKGPGAPATPRAVRVPFFVGSDQLASGAPVAQSFVGAGAVGAFTMGAASGGAETTTTVVEQQVSEPSVVAVEQNLTAAPIAQNPAVPTTSTQVSQPIPSSPVIPPRGTPIRVPESGGGLLLFAVALIFMAAVGFYSRRVRVAR